MAQGGIDFFFKEREREREREREKTTMFKWIYNYDYVSIACFSIKNVTKITVDG